MQAMSTTETSDGPGHDVLDDDGPDAQGEDEHGHDEHGHNELGPVDVQAWGALALGVAAGLVIVLCLVLTTSILA